MSPNVLKRVFPLLSAAVLAISGSASAATYQHGPSIAGQGEIRHYFSGDPDWIYIGARDAAQNITVGILTLGTTSGDYRGVFEYNISTIPQGAVIESATFAVGYGSYNGGGSSGYPELRMYGHVGDGVLTEDDVTRTDTYLDSAVVNSFGGRQLNVASSFLQPLVNAGEDNLTLQLRGNGIDGLSVYLASQPSLTITYSVPEPVSAGLLLLASPLLLRRGRVRPENGR